MVEDLFIRVGVFSLPRGQIEVFFLPKLRGGSELSFTGVAVLCSWLLVSCDFFVVYLGKVLPTAADWPTAPDELERKCLDALARLDFS